MSPCPFRKLAVIVLGPLLWLPAAAWARELAFPLDADPAFRALLAEALERSPELQSAVASTAAASARVRPAGALPDPILSVSYMNGGQGWSLGSDPDTTLGLAVSQEFPLAGKRGLLTAIETQQVEIARSALERRKLRLATRLRLAYTDLLLARRRLALIAEQERLVADITATTRSRYAVGLAAQPDVLRSQAELARLGREVLGERGISSLATIELNRLAARTPGTPVEPGLELESVAAADPGGLSVEELMALAEDRSPDLAAAAAAVERAQLRRELADRGRKPDLMTAARYEFRGPLPPRVTIDVGIVTPLYAGRKQRQRVAEEEAATAAESAELAATRLRVRAAVERGVAALDTARAEADAYAGAILALDALAAEAALAGYKTGQVPFVSVLDAQSTLYRDRMEQAELLARVLRQHAELLAFGAAE